MPFLILTLLSLLLAGSASASDLQAWLSSEARAELVAAFESSDCRLPLTEVSDILFEYDLPEEPIYAERLILMEAEAEPLVFPVVLVTGDVCDKTGARPIVVPAAALDYANELLAERCVMDVSALETLTYPDDLTAGLTTADRRNVVSELYNRNLATFRYATKDGVDTLRVHSLSNECVQVD